jgi:hypothetical protein
MREPRARDDRRRSLADEHDEDVDEAFEAAVKPPRVVVLVTLLAIFAVLGVGGAVGASTLLGAGGGPTAAHLAPSESPATGAPEAGGAETTPGADAPASVGAGAGATPGGSTSPSEAAPGDGGSGGEPGDGPGGDADGGSGGTPGDSPGGTPGGSSGGTPGEGQPGSPPGASDGYGADVDLDEVPAPPADWSDAARADAERWLAVQGVIARCMRDKGFEYVFLPYWLGGDRDGVPPGRTARTDGPWLDALEGRQRNDRGRGNDDRDKNWRQAGCRGYAEHVAG